MLCGVSSESAFGAGSVASKLGIKLTFNYFQVMIKIKVTFIAENLATLPTIPRSRESETVPPQNDKCNLFYKEDYEIIIGRIHIHIYYERVCVFFYSARPARRIENEAGKSITQGRGRRFLRAPLGSDEGRYTASKRRARCREQKKDELGCCRWA